MERREGPMKRAMAMMVILAGVLFLAGCVPMQHASRTRGASAPADTASLMTKQNVISLSQAGVSDSIIVTMLDASGSYFQLTTQDVLDLKSAGVHEGVIQAMLAIPGPSDETTASEGGRGYPPYWYARYYPYWDPWYLPTYPFGFGYRYYQPFYVRHVAPSHFGGFGGGWGRSAGGGHGGGRRR
jgi:hypothetical protein